MNTNIKYKAIAQQIITSIEKGGIEANTKLPSLRMFCQLHLISMTTAIACYRYLEQHGYINSEYKKGYYVQALHIKKHNLTFPTFQSTVTKNISRPDIQPNSLEQCTLSTAQLDEKLIDEDLLKRSLKAITKHSHFKLNYDDIQGSILLRQQLSKHFNNQGFSFSYNELIITHGCLDAVLIAVECVSKPGDVIAVTSPCYSGLLDLIAVLGRSILEIPSTSNGIDIKQLEKAMKEKTITSCLLTANHQNPTGHSISNQQKQNMVKLAAQYHIPIIEDDVFREVSHQQTVPLPIKYFDQQGWVIWCSSVSKTLAPGLRIGWCLPGRFKKEFIYQRTTRTLGHNIPIQLALADYIANGYYEKHIKKINRILATHCTDYIKFLHKNLPENSEVYTPNGGLVLWIKLVSVNTEKLALLLSKQGIYIKHGNLFSSTKLYQDCFRLNIGNIPSKKIYSQLTLLCEMARDESKE